MQLMVISMDSLGRLMASAAVFVLFLGSSSSEKYKI